MTDEKLDAVIMKADRLALELTNKRIDDLTEKNAALSAYHQIAVNMFTEYELGKFIDSCDEWDLANQGYKYGIG